MPNLTKTQKRRKLKAQVAALEEKAQNLGLEIKVKNLPEYRTREHTNLIQKISRIKSKFELLGGTWTSRPAARHKYDWMTKPLIASVVLNIILVILLLERWLR